MLRVRQFGGLARNNPYEFLEVACYDWQSKQSERASVINATSSLKAFDYNAVARLRRIHLVQKNPKPRGRGRGDDGGGDNPPMEVLKTWI